MVVYRMGERESEREVGRVEQPLVVSDLDDAANVALLPREPAPIGAAPGSILVIPSSAAWSCCPA